MSDIAIRRVISSPARVHRMDVEKQGIFGPKRMIRARSVVCLRSIFGVCCFPLVCVAGSM
jgi:hypothetical protein